MSALTTLAAQQTALLEAIFTTNTIANSSINTSPSAVNLLQNRGLQTYRASAHAAATRSLQASYPVIAQLIGEEAFEHLARDLWAQHPPQRGDLAQWGGDLAVFIASISALQTEPYLSDVARAEWALHTAATLADQSADLATFSLLTEHDPATVSLHLAPGTTLISSLYPIASILTAHLYELPSFEAVGQKIRDNTAETALAWRQGLRPRVAACQAGEAVFIKQLLAGRSLLTALETAEPFDLQIWLPNAVQTGLLLGAKLIQPATMRG